MAISEKKKSKRDSISCKMSRIRAKNTSIENFLSVALSREGIKGYRRNLKSVLGTPDFCWKGKKIAVFCDSSFWHGYDWKNQIETIKTRKKFWINKIETNIARDRKVNKKLRQEGWRVLRFWDFEIKRNALLCAKKISKISRAYS